MSAVRSHLAAVSSLLLARSVFAGEDPPAPCAPRIAEKLGVRFVEVCAVNTADFPDAPAHDEGALPAFWIAAVPLPCTAGEHETVECETVTALEASPLASRHKNRPVEAMLVDAVTAHRTCTLRFGGRLPTPLEREQARHVLGLASLLVRDGPDPARRIWLDDLPEWVAEGDCLTSPSKPGPGCRIAQFPPVMSRPLREGDSRLACGARPAGLEAPVVPIGAACAERPAQGGVRSPDCAVAFPGGAPDARFELACRAAPLDARAAAAHPRAEHAAFRCVVLQLALGRFGEPP